MKYAHGEYVVSRCGAIMAVQAQGPWNRECVVKFAEDYRSEREGLAGNRWGDIVFVTGESLFRSGCCRRTQVSSEECYETGLKSYCSGVR